MESFRHTPKLIDQEEKGGSSAQNVVPPQLFLPLRKKNTLIEMAADLVKYAVTCFVTFCPSGVTWVRVTNPPAVHGRQPGKGHLWESGGQ